MLLTLPAQVCIRTQQHLLQVSAVRSSVRSCCRRKRQRQSHSHWLWVLTWVWPDGSLVWPDKMAVPPPRITRACWSRTLCSLLMTSASRIFPICRSKDRDKRTGWRAVDPPMTTVGTAHVSRFIHNFLSTSPPRAGGSLHSTSDNRFLMRVTDRVVCKLYARYQQDHHECSHQVPQ